MLGILPALAILASLTMPAFADGPDYTTGTPWICSDLDGVVTEETTAEVKDNFVLAVNKDKILARNRKMEDYFNAIHPWKGQDIYGSIVTGEAGADMAGMKVVLRIAAEKENFDYDAFFRAYADLWFEKDTLQMVYRHINDVHPISYLRVNCTLQQFDEFLDCYGITEGDGMYLAPADRVIAW